MPKLVWFSLLYTTLPLSLSAQAEKLMIYSFSEATLDSIIVDQDNTLLNQGRTAYNLGTLDNLTANLKEVIPTDNVYENSMFTIRRRAALDFDIREFPIRTTVKIFSVENGSLINNCSGSFISEKHVLTSAHCFTERGKNTPRPEQDSLLVCPVFDNGNPDPLLGCSSVSMMYSFGNWTLEGTDFAFLELEDNLGLITGWLGFGFYDAADELIDKPFYKFSYPNSSYLFPGLYNGDSLYYAYGKLDIYEENFLGINHSYCEFGESGSHIISIAEDDKYTSYGTVTYGINCRHNRITRNVFNALNYVTDREIVSFAHPVPTLEDIVLYPNPATDYIYFRELTGRMPVEARLYNQSGKLLKIISISEFYNEMDLTDYPVGMYLVKLISSDGSRVISFIKSH